MRVAVATGTDVDLVRRKPYARTLWTFLHLEQERYVNGLRERGHALNAAGLTALAFHEPKKLTDEHRQLKVDAGLVEPAEIARENALSLVAEVAKVDQAGAWKPMGGVA